jgi:hypothetical protein
MGLAAAWFADFPHAPSGHVAPRWLETVCAGCRVLPRAPQSAKWEPVRELFAAEWETAMQLPLTKSGGLTTVAKSPSTKDEKKSSTLRAE